MNIGTTAIPKSQVVALYRKALISGIPLEKVEQKVETMMTRSKVTEKVERQDQEKRSKALKNKIPRIVKIGAALVPVFFILIGLSLLGSAVIPIAGYYLTEMPQLQAKTLTTPIPPEQVLDVNPVIITQVGPNGAGTAIKPNQEPIILESELDYTNLSNWFAGGPLPDVQTGASPQAGATEEVYTLDIPSINIANAKVTVGGTDLNKSLIHYTGTALPGELGSPVIFGHSVLRQFYNPSEKNPRRYNSIFSYIMTLKKGDKIYLTKGNIKYTYAVEEKTEVKPTDVHILAQKYDSRKLKLVTCTPEGTYLRRGVVTAVLINE